MYEFPMQNITIYHKNGNKWDRYVKVGSFRNTSILNRNKTGLNSVDNALVRIFDVREYNLIWFAEKGDIMVNQGIEDIIEGTTPLTQLKKKYGDSNVFKINSIDKFRFDDEDIKDLNHIKLGCI